MSHLRSVLAGTIQQIVVVAACDELPERVVGIASAALTSDGTREIGVLVEDRYQAQGIGRSMLDCLIGLLDPSEHLSAISSAENRWLLRKLARYGTVTLHHEYGLIRARIDRPISATDSDQK